MKFSARSASGIAILASLATAFPAWAQVAQTVTTSTDAGGPQQQSSAAVDQTTPAAAQAQSRDLIIVTGSNIAGAAEDAALPVEVYSAEELEEQGAPTALEFVKTLTISGPTTGEAYYFGGAASTGAPAFNLRGIGADKTLTLLNGRRMSDNASNIPSAALARTEVLKDGAAVIYGADATGGVVNFVTRDSFNGLEVKGQYKLIDGSDGDYGMSILGGVGEGDTNFLWSAEWEHRSTLRPLDRDWAFQPFSVNPAPWSTLTNLAGYTALGAYPAAASANTRTAEYGPALSATAFQDFTPASCEAVGGVFVNSFTCRYNFISYYDLVAENDIYRAYAQMNSRISDTMDFHAEVSFGKVSSPHVYGSPAQPVVRGPARPTGATFQFYVPRTNPYFAEFATRSGLAANPIFSSVQGVSPVTFRAFAHGGNPFLGEPGRFGVPSRVDNQSWRVMSELKGELGDWAGAFKEVGYTFAATYNENQSEFDQPDILGYRLQEALNGFGGPNCRAVDQNPLQFGTQNPAAAGQNGCLWFNPFASSFPNQPETGQVNPSYVQGADNSAEVARWLVDPRLTESTTRSLTIDLLFNGETPITLPGGNVAWAAGTQWRQVEFGETVRSDLYNGNQPCDWPSNFTTGVVLPGSTTPVPVVQQPRVPDDPLYTGCNGPVGPGGFVFFGDNPPDNADRQQFSYFAELNLPVFDSFNLQAAVRREDFSGDLGATVYKVGGKWDVFGPISIRGSYGTNYQAPPLGLIPGDVNFGNVSYTIAGSDWRSAVRITEDSVQPETATASNLGVIWQSQGFGDRHDFQFIVDYFNIETEDEIGDLVSHNQIANSVFNTPVATRCANPLVSRITFNAGFGCGPGLTVPGTANFSAVTTLVGNAFGQTTSGFDLQTRYSMPVGGGDLTFDVTGTLITELTTSARILDGFVVAPADDRVGNLNFDTVAVAAPELRINAFAAYRWGDQTLRLQTNYVSAVKDDRAGVQYAEEGEEWLTGDLYYNLDLPSDFRLSLSVVNIFDQDPPPAQEELGYDPRIGSPLGRTFEIGIKKTF